MSEPLVSAHAGAELADRLRQAWLNAGKPHMERIGDEVGYSKATISKVMSGKMPPAWHLVRKLGIVLGVPAATIIEEWHPLWIAADNFRRAVPEDGAEQAAELTGEPCGQCGSWVVDVRLHADWHLRLEQPGILRSTETHDWASLRDAVRRKER